MSIEKTFVTGATGFIGSHLVKRLGNGGHRVVVFVREKSSTRFINKYVDRYEMEIKRGDITNQEQTVSAMKGCSVIFHNAALAADWGKKEDFYRTNVEGTEKVLKAAKTNRVKSIVLTSSTAVLGEENCQEKKGENAPYRPDYPYFLSRIWESNMNDYRRTKMLAEKRAIAFCEENGIPLTVIRPVWVYGPREFHSGPYYFCKSVSEGTRLLPGCKTNRFHTIYVKDLVEVIIRLSEKGLPGVNVFNVGSKVVPTMDEFWRLFCGAMDKPPPIYLPKWLVYPVGLSMEGLYKSLGMKDSPLLTRARVVMGYCSNIYDTSKWRKEIGSYEETPLERGVKTTVRWWKMNGYL